MTLNNNSPTDNLIREKWMDAPERIWVEFDNEFGNHITWEEDTKGYADACYIREDIHRAQADRDRARIEALEGALRGFVEHGALQDREYLSADLNAKMDAGRAALANTASDRDKPDA